MSGLVGFLLGVLGGFAAHTVTMKVSFKLRTIDNKIKVFDSLIGTWVKMRNFIFYIIPARQLPTFHNRSL